MVDSSQERMGNTRWEFTPGFKDEAVKLVINTGRRVPDWRWLLVDDIRPQIRIFRKRARQIVAVDDLGVLLRQSCRD